jgi:hypothetical protein
MLATQARCSWRSSGAGRHLLLSRIMDESRMFSFPLLVQVGLREHLQELAAAALVDGHGQQLAVTPEKERPGDASNVESLVHFAAGIENDIGCVLVATNELRHFESVFVGDGQDDKTL